MYKKDILLYSDIEVRLTKRKEFELICKMSKRIYHFRSDAAGDWVNSINEVISTL